DARGPPGDRGRRHHAGTGARGAGGRRPRCRRHRGDPRGGLSRRRDPSLSRGAGPARVKVLVVGGGIIGCATAYELAKSGCQVTVFERSTPGAEASSAAAGLPAPLGAPTETNFAPPAHAVCLL